MTLQERMERELEDLRATRDELRVRLHLGKLDAQEQWEQVEKQWQHVESKLKLAREAGREVAEDIGEATSLVIEEMKEGSPSSASSSEIAAAQKPDLAP